MSAANAVTFSLERDLVSIPRHRHVAVQDAVRISFVFGKAFTKGYDKVSVMGAGTFLERKWNLYFKHDPVRL
jgi:hypothetical protein